MSSSSDLGRTGTNVPNRIFVGGLSPGTTEDELLDAFQQYGNVTATKIITDRAGLSKGYGFVTFMTDNEARTALMEAQGVTLRDRKLNVAQAYRKGSATMNDTPRAVVFPGYSNVPLSGRESLCFQAAQMPMMPAYYFGQYPQNTAGSYYPYVYSLPQEMSYDQMPSEEHDVGKQYAKPNSVPGANNVDYESRTSHIKSCHSSAGGSAFRFSTGSSPVLHHHQPISFHHLMPKTLNGMTVLAYPSPFMVGTPALVHVKESSNDQENLMSEISYLHSPVSNNALTPPPTPLAPMPCDFGSATGIESVRKN